MRDSRRGLAVVVVAYRNTADLRRCLHALGGAFPVVVVDNDDDRAVEQLVRGQGHEYLAPGSNIGFAAAVNLGLVCSVTAGRDVLLLNPDARIDAEQVRLLQAHLHATGNERIAAVAPSLRNSDGAAERVEWPFPSPGRAVLEAVAAGELVRPAGCFLIGAVLLLRREAIDDVGPFDERFFLYAEEADWQMRACRRGWSAQLCQDVVALHESGGSSSDPLGREALFYAASETFYRKWYGAAGWQVARAAAVAGSAARLALRRAQADRRRLHIHLAGPRSYAARMRP